MYWHYVRHGVRPSEFFQMGVGERVILRAFMLKEVEEDKKLQERLEAAKGGG